jgi:hypothetical protein
MLKSKLNSTGVHSNNSTSPKKREEGKRRRSNRKLTPRTELLLCFFIIQVVVVGVFVLQTTQLQVRHKLDALCFVFLLCCDVATSPAGEQQLMHKVLYRHLMLYRFSLNAARVHSLTTHACHGAISREHRKLLRPISKRVPMTQHWQYHLLINSRLTRWHVVC